MRRTARALSKHLHLYISCKRRPRSRIGNSQRYHGQRYSYTQRIIWYKGLKYVFNGFDRDEMYDLSADPEELHNLIDDPLYEGKKKQLVSLMWKKMEESGDWAMPTTVVSVVIRIGRSRVRAESRHACLTGSWFLTLWLIESTRTMPLLTTTPIKATMPTMENRLKLCFMPIIAARYTQMARRMIVTMVFP